MALVQYTNIDGSVESRRMHAPKKATIESWYKAARVVIPQIPKLGEVAHRIENTTCTTRWIRWELTCVATGERSIILIDRSQSSI